MHKYFVFLLLALLTGCVAYGSANVQRGDMIATATYFRLGDQRLQDFYVDYDKNGTASLGLGQQQSSSAELRETLLKALGVAQ